MLSLCVCTGIAERPGPSADSERFPYRWVVDQTVATRTRAEPVRPGLGVRRLHSSAWIKSLLQSLEGPARAGQNKGVDVTVSRD
jgi:hypothetical protein